MANESLQSELIDALKLRISVIGDQELRASDPAAQLAQLQEVSQRITALQAQLPGGTHPQLRHFFERCSYDKALAWLETEGLNEPSK